MSHYSARLRVAITPEMRNQIVENTKALGYFNAGEYVRACLTAGMSIVDKYKEPTPQIVIV
jgi:hypothetical protein